MLDVTLTSTELLGEPEVNKLNSNPFTFIRAEHEIVGFQVIVDMFVLVELFYRRDNLNDYFKQLWCIDSLVGLEELLKGSGLLLRYMVHKILPFANF